MQIYVGNLSYNTREQTLNDLFSQYGEVSRAKVITDRETGKAKGFGFVEMPNDSQANAAIEALNGKDVDGRSIRVNEAKPKEDNGGSRDRDTRRRY